MTKFARLLYTLVAWLFVAGVLTQVFFAGMVVVARQWSWENHIDMGYGLAYPIIALVVLVFLGRFPGRMKVATLLLMVAYATQLFLIYGREAVPALSALHPVMALIDFGLGLYLATQATAVVRWGAQVVTQPVGPDLQTSD